MDLSYKTKVEKLLLKYLKKETYSGCALGFSRIENEFIKRELFFKGKINKNIDGIPVNKETFFDLASLTKPLVTVLSLLALLKEGTISLNDSIAELLPDQICPQDKKKITLKNLITHTSGLPPHRPFYKNLSEKIKPTDNYLIVDLILRENLESLPGYKYIYSDLDYILLGCIIEQISKKKLAEFWREEIAKKLNISNSFYTYDCLDKSNYKSINFAETGKCFWSDVNLDGIVHDDNCRAMGSMRGHAGLFANLDGVLGICEFILDFYNKRKSESPIDRDIFTYFIRKKSKENWAYGFDVVSGDTSSSGNLFSDESIGHLGYTGTSFWIDLKKNVIIVLLTNRVIFGSDSSKIKEMRPQIHNLLMEYIVKTDK